MILIDASPLAEGFWALAVLVAASLPVALAPRHGLDRPDAFRASLAMLAGGWLGGTILPWLEWGVPGSAGDLLTAGKSSLGGLVGGMLGLALHARMRRNRTFLREADLMVTGLGLAYAIGRLGCFCHGCSFGATTALPWAVTYPAGTEAHAAQVAQGLILANASASLPVHPVQLYSAAAGLAIFLALLRPIAGPPGGRLALAASLFGLERLLTAGLRGDFPPLAGPLSWPQLAGLALMFAGGALSWSLRQRNPDASSIAPAALRATD